MIGIGDDSGLTVNALDGAPGIFSARYAGEHGNDALNNKKLLEDMKDKTDRSAAFVCCIACVFPDGRVLMTEDSCEGIILRAPRGNGGFGYDPYFYCEEFNKTFAELTLEVKNSVSHRAKAFRKFAESFVKTWETYYAEQ
jgi:XTP/dITP diphosphohydrolase